MTNLSVRRHPLRSVGYAAVAGALFVLACDASTPGEPEEPVLSKQAVVGAPLYVVDGVIMGAGVLDIDTLSVESIKIVKGAAAEARFGDREKNGVVLITTKKPD